MTAKPAYVWSGSEWVPVGPVTPTSPFHYQATPPSSPANGDVWVDSDGDLDALVLNAGDFATQTDLTSGLADKADIDGPTFTGTVNLPATTNYDGTQLSNTLASKLDLAGGKILQIVRATDSTARSTTSASFVDASISVTITPQKSDSSVLLIWLSYASPTGGSSNYQAHQITDNSNNAISGAEKTTVGSTDSFTNYASFILIGYATPATTSPVTYKGRFLANTGVTARLSNTVNTGQMYAIEVSA